MDEVARRSERMFAAIGREVVSMERHKEVTVPPDGNSIELFTLGVLGCNVVALVTELPDGTRRAQLSHYGRTTTSLQGGAISEYLDSSAVGRTRAVLIVPGEPEKGPDGRYSLKAEPNKSTDYLRLLLDSALAPDSIQVAAYSLNVKQGEDRLLRFRIFPHASEDPTNLAEISWWEAPIRLTGTPDPS